MICEICGEKYKYSCAHCTRRVMTWGEDGYLKMREFAEKSEDILAYDLFELFVKYYQGTSKKRDDISTTIKRAIYDLGYKGKIIGRIHRNGKSYVQIRKREHTAAKRYKLKKDKCDKCGATEDLYLHHIIPISWGGKSNPENCITLCKECHEKTHKKLAKKLNRALLLKYLEPHLEEIETFAKQSL